MTFANSKPNGLPSRRRDAVAAVARDACDVARQDMRSARAAFHCCQPCGDRDARAQTRRPRVASGNGYVSCGTPPARTLATARQDVRAAQLVRQVAAKGWQKVKAHHAAAKLEAQKNKLNADIRNRTAARATLTAGSPPVHGIRVDVGAGKSTEARRQAAIRLAAMRAAGDARTGLFMVPTIDLADEQAALFRALPEATALTVAVWRGRERPDPDHPGNAMCRDLDAVADAQEAWPMSRPAYANRQNPDGTIKCQVQVFR